MASLSKRHLFGIAAIGGGIGFILSKKKAKVSIEISDDDPDPVPNPPEKDPEAEEETDSEQDAPGKDAESEKETGPEPNPPKKEEEVEEDTEGEKDPKTPPEDVAEEDPPPPPPPPPPPNPNDSVILPGARIFSAGEDISAELDEKGLPEIGVIDGLKLKYSASDIESMMDSVDRDEYRAFKKRCQGLECFAMFVVASPEAAASAISELEISLTKFPTAYVFILILEDGIEDDSKRTDPSQRMAVALDRGENLGKKKVIDAIEALPKVEAFSIAEQGGISKVLENFVNS